MLWWRIHHNHAEYFEGDLFFIFAHSFFFPAGENDLWQGWEWGAREGQGFKRPTEQGQKVQTDER